jgi:hypothetical protein
MKKLSKSHEAARAYMAGMAEAIKRQSANKNRTDRVDVTFEEWDKSYWKWRRKRNETIRIRNKKG